MCGIAGIWDTQGQREIDVAQLARMNERLHHRGPDAGGVHTEAGVGLAHRRLSIIDISSGHQPLFNEDGSVVVVFNGEIYNFQSLMAELAALGHTFRTHSDTEVIVHAWEEWGEDCVTRFDGMFAFGLWDRHRQCLFLARDQIGIKPLYYALLDNGELIFASELKALLVHPGVRREIDPLAIEEYFALGYVPEPRTILRQALKLPPGHSLRLQRGQPMPPSKQYWDVSFKPHHFADEQALAEAVAEQVRETVRSHLMSEVPLGAFLSGGVDSSAVVAMMAEIAPDTAVNTCSMGFGDPRFNETEFAAMVAERYHTDHHVEQVNPDDFDLIDKLAGLYDEPYADCSAIPTYRVCELARKRVTVALSGDGGDESFAGYRRYRWHMREEAIRSKLPQAIRGPVFGTLGSLYPKIDWAPRFLRAKSVLQGLACDSIEGYYHSISILTSEQRQRLFSKSFRQTLQGYNAIEVFRGHAAKAPTDHPLSLVQYIDMKTYLPGDILTKVDRASMAHSLEVRVPLLEHRFVDWVSGIPPEMKLRNGEGKYIFKKSLEPYLPNDVLYRKKMGFSVPLASWFRGPLRERVRQSVLGSRMLDSGYFDASYLRELVDQHQSGARDHSAALWALLMFDAFMGNLDLSVAA